MDMDVNMAVEPGAPVSDSGHDHDGHDGHDGRNGHDSPNGGGGRLSEPRRRNRPALSCIQCRTRKIRCDRNEPCASCIKSKIVNCTYEEARRPKPRLWKLSPAPSSVPGPRFNAVQTVDGPAPRFAPDGPYREPQPSTGAASGLQYAGSASSVPSVRNSESTTASLPSPTARYVDSGSAVGSAPVADTLLKQIRQLEQELADLRSRDPMSQSSQSSQSTHSSQQPPTRNQPSITKARYLGASHWMNDAKLFPMVLGIAERIESDKGSDIYHLLQKCKNLGRSIKSQRVPTQISFDVGSAIPPETVACCLVEAYFRTFESVYRIVHRPTFWKQYKNYWQDPAGASPDFIVQFQLCMAIGTCFQDEVATLRQSATRWIYEAQIWLVSPSEKSRMNISGLQIICLLHLARETCGVGGDLTWISAGSLLRTAMYIGLHRDPDNLPKMSVFRAEMRRRLWATILEIVLQSSLDAGGPPLLSLSDFDTRPPANFDDDQLSENEQHTQLPRPPGTFTQTTVQLALLRSFPTRLAVAHFVNHFNSITSYEETLRLNSELTTACRALSATLQPFYDPAGVLPKRLSLFQLRLVEQMVHRFFLALNHPWLCLAQSKPAYYFSRKMCVETALKLYRAFSTCSPSGASGTASQTDDFTRLLTCGHGAFRSVPVQAVLTIFVELLWQTQDERSFRQSLNIDHQLNGPSPSSEADVSSSGGIGSGAAPTHDLYEAAKYSIGWTERRIRMGEVTVKGYLFFALLLAQVHALQRGVSDAEIERFVIDALTDGLSYCWHLLKDTAAITSTPMSLSGGFGSGLGVDGNGVDECGAVLGSEWDRVSDFDLNQGFGAIFKFNDVNFFIDS
ncbi:hypothetical protein B0H66DRAFT_224751 [Apodospora peruviana]|uniref:Zn(2)-C6 fungal-type domain-containing protein n=1 Tax=Apodospora peruviana TaxID=516989 RepID=A0AAE0M3Q0_9PEZI|nr:hypothetical protein B0H66DRAFT_224751 [Apodospora peruviana]